MILSHKYKFIYVKTRKTASTSIEVYFAHHAGPDDVITPIAPVEEGHAAQNHRGIFNPIPELRARKTYEYRHAAHGLGLKGPLRDLRDHRQFYDHMPAWEIRNRVSTDVWRSYFKFTVERNPWDKTLSYAYFKRGAHKSSKNMRDFVQDRQLPFNFHLYTEPSDHSQVIVDQVLRYENLDAELGRIFEGLGVPYDGSLGVRAKGGYRNPGEGWDQWTPELVEAVRLAFRHELALFPYEAPTHGYFVENREAHVC